MTLTHIFSPVQNSLSSNGKATVRNYDETDPLRSVIVFNPGLESYLIEGNIKRIKDYGWLVGYLKQLGITVYNGREILGTNPAYNGSVNGLQKHLLEALREQHLEAKEALIGQLYKMDIYRFGEVGAYSLNCWLSYGKPFNVRFGDSFNVVGDRLLLEKPDPVQKPEIGVAAKALERIGIYPKVIDGLRAGEIVVWNGTVWLKSDIHDNLAPEGFETIHIDAKKRLHRYFRPLDSCHVLVHPETARECRISEGSRNLLGILERRADVIPLSEGDMKAAEDMVVVNSGHISPRHAIVPYEGGLSSMLEGAGFDVSYSGFSGLHHLVGQLYRG